MSFFDTLEKIKIGSLSLSTLLSALIVLIVCLIAIKIIKRVLNRVSGRVAMEKGLRTFLTSIITAALWAIAIIIVAGTLGIPTASLVALLSVAGLALSLSIQGIMSNLFSGATILAAKPFKSGDFVELDSVSGTVDQIGLFHTQILTIDNRRIFVPNSEVTSTKIINYSSEPLRRVDMVYSAGYGCGTDTVKAALLEAVYAVPQLLKEPAPEVYLSAYSESNIEYILRAWCKTGDYWPAYFALNEAVRESFGRAGISPSFRRVVLHAAGDGGAEK